MLWPNQSRPGSGSLADQVRILEGRQADEKRLLPRVTPKVAAKIMDTMKTRPENGCNSIDLLLTERFSQLFSLALTQTLIPLPMKIRWQSRILVNLRRSGN